MLWIYLAFQHGCNNLLKLLHSDGKWAQVVDAHGCEWEECWCSAPLQFGPGAAFCASSPDSSDQHFAGEASRAYWGWLYIRWASSCSYWQYTQVTSARYLMLLSADTLEAKPFS